MAESVSKMLSQDNVMFCKFADLTVHNRPSLKAFTSGVLRKIVILGIFHPKIPTNT